MFVRLPTRNNYLYKMKFGVKTYNDEKFLDFFNEKCDFFEVQAIRGNNYSFLKKYKLPIVIHCEHDVMGINIANPLKEKENIDSINFAKKLADFVGAKKIIIHPGIYENDLCTIENSINFLKNNCDLRFCIENVPSGIKFNVKKLGSSVEEMKHILKETGLNFCLDINHAIEYAFYEKLDYLKIIAEFEKLKPKHYHIGGEKMSELVSHLSFKKSDLNLDKIFSLVNENAEFTLETEVDIPSVVDDLKTIKKYRKTTLKN